MKKLLVAFVHLLFVAPVAGLAEPALAPVSTLATFESHVEAVAATDDIVGLAVAIVRDGDIVFQKSYGEKSVGGGDAIDHDTVFRIASLSKAFAATAAAQLATEGKLSLDDPATKYAPALRLKRQSQAPTLEHVLSHRLGLPPYAYDNLLEAGIAPETILRRLGEVDPICRVGQCYGYQNVAFNTIADAISTAEGRPYEAVLDERVFAPLSLPHASVGMDGLTATENWAQSHRRRRGQSWRIEPVKQPYYDVPAAGGVNASITDMALWLQALTDDASTVVSPEVRTLLFSPRVATPGEIRRNRQMKRINSAHYGLGWRIYDYAGETVINHSGGVEGYSAQIAFLPERDVGIVLLTNSNSKPFWGILPTFLDLELGLATAVIKGP